MKIAKNHDFRKKSIFPIVQISDLYIDITQYTNQGGGAWVYPFFEEKNFDFRFLSDYMVPATPKYISG